MARRFSVEVVLKARDRASKVIRGAGQSISALTARLGTAGLVAAGAAAVASVAALRRGLTTATEAAAETEAQLNRVVTAIALSGESTTGAAAAMAKWSQELQRATGVTDETALQLFRIAKGFGATTEQAKLMAATAVDFAAAVDINAVEAIRRLGRAMQGSTEDISKFAPEIRKLSKAQLAAGEATELLAERFRGISERTLGTYKRAVQDLDNALDDLAGAVGAGLTGPEVVDAIRDRERALRSLQRTVETSNGGIGKLAGGWERLKTLGVELGAVIADQASFLLDHAFGLDDSAAASDRAAGATDRLAGSMDRAARVARDLKQTTDASRDSLAAFGVELLPDVEVQLSKAQDAEQQLEKAFREGLVSRKQYAEASEEIADKQKALRAVLNGTVSSVEEYDQQAQEAAAAAEGFADGLGEAATAGDRAAASTRAAAASAQALRPALQSGAAQARITAREFDRLAASVGRAAAVQAALSGGAKVVNRTRISLPGGGSRLIRSPGFDS